MNSTTITDFFLREIWSYPVGIYTKRSYMIWPTRDSLTRGITLSIIIYSKMNWKWTRSSAFHNSFQLVKQRGLGGIPKLISTSRNAGSQPCQQHQGHMNKVATMARGRLSVSTTELTPTYQSWSLMLLLNVHTASKETKSKPEVQT